MSFPIRSKTIHNCLLNTIGFLLFWSSTTALANPTVQPTSNVAPTGQSFALERNNTPVDNWWIYIGTQNSSTSKDIHDSGLLSGALTSYAPPVTLTPGTLYLTLWHKEEGQSWQHDIIELQVDEFGQTLPVNASEGNLVYYDGSSWVAAAPSIVLDPIELSQPSLGLNCLIAMVGVYPSRSAAEPLLGEIMFAGFNFAPRNWAKCDGQILPISQHTALFSLLGTIYGGDGRTTFALPDLRGRTPVHFGTGPGLSPRTLGQKFGQESTVITN